MLRCLKKLVCFDRQAILNEGYFMIIRSDFEVLNCWNFPCKFWSVGLLKTYLQILKCCVVELLPTDFEMLVCWTANHRFWSVGLLSCYKPVSNYLLFCLLQISKCFVELLLTDIEVLFFWTLPYRFWSVVLLFCYPHAMKCCLLNCYPHLMCGWPCIVIQCG